MPHLVTPRALALCCLFMLGGMLLGLEAFVKTPLFVAPSGPAPRRPGSSAPLLYPRQTSRVHIKGIMTAVQARGSEEEVREEEQRPKAKKPLAISVAKQLRRMKEPGPAQTTVLLARMLKNAFTQTPIENFALLLGDIGILCSTRLMEDMILVPAPYRDMEHIHQIESYTGLDLMHTSPAGWVHAYSTFADGMQMGLAWVLAVVMARGYPVSIEATGTIDQRKSLMTTTTTFAVAAFFRVAMTSLQATAMDEELDLLLLLVDLTSMFTGVAMWRFLFTEINRIRV